MTEPATTPVDFRTTLPKLTVSANAWQAWWEDVEMWDGFVQYADLDTAKRYAAAAYISDEYSWHADDDPADEAPDVNLAWSFERGRWYLLADGRGTGVQLYRSNTYSAAEPAAPSLTAIADTHLPAADPDCQCLPASPMAPRIYADCCLPAADPAP
ncbi:hypothetical protein ACFXA3_00440 [Streptomyces sp. NPDC059456]|uniref:hypothetical protein n=1 Tax=Streptomyces sp. NPDC059456 TaxID=3346838 RepID=UPI0036A5C540